MFKKKIAECVIGLAFLIGIGGCTSGPKVEEFADTANSADEVQRLSADMRSAIDRQVDVLAPSAFEEADKALKTAVTAQQKGKDAKDILHSVAVGRAYLNRATKSAELSTTNMEEVVAARQAAITAGARKSMSEDLNNADDKLRSVTSDVENNNLDDVAQNRGKLQKAYLDVELKTIKLENLAAARATIAQAIKEGADDHAKQSLAIAEKKANDTEAFITANRHETDAVRSRSEEARNAANHLLKITRASKAGQNISSEEAALRLESEQNKAQGSKDQLVAERKLAKGLAVEAGNLKSDQAFNQSFELARSEFTTEEAEVYRQGNRLVIRLRALEFPINQSVLRSDNFPLLAKVAKVIGAFDNSTVLVEGHTDSDGGKALNHKLATERAKAISEYLISNGAVEQNMITAVGFGSERPLASNKTPKGKAQNRRVDISITPTDKSAE